MTRVRLHGSCFHKWTAQIQLNKSRLNSRSSFRTARMTRSISSPRCLRNTASKMPFCAEEQLLLAIARRELDERRVDELRQSARAPLDWDYVLATAFGHGLVPLLQKNLMA